MATSIKDPEPQKAGSRTDGAIRVMLVDDSAIIRGLIGKVIEPEPGVTVVASVADGAQAVKRLSNSKGDIDVIVLDIEMPVMDGLTALPKLIQLDPNVKIIMASTLTERNADISIKALAAGAADYLPKPTSTTKITGASDFRHELLEKIKTLGAASRKAAGRPVPRVAGAPTTAAPESLYSGPLKLRKATHAVPPEVVAIGSSTGGPQALLALFKDLKPTIDVPVVITQHMPPMFTRILAEHIARASGWNCAEAKDGDILAPNQAYLAPGDFHMEIADEPSGPVVRLSQSPPENFCRPAVDPMFRSLAKTFGNRVLASILTGMGADGMKGGQVLTKAGGTLIAQDEKTSVIWGMPGAVAIEGLCSAVLPIDELGTYIMKFMGKGR